jgi:hypothetical protein
MRDTSATINERFEITGKAHGTALSVATPTRSVLSAQVSFFRSVTIFFPALR